MSNASARIKEIDSGQNYCFVLLEYLGAYTSIILFDIGLVLIYLYTGLVKKWKGLPEG